MASKWWPTKQQVQDPDALERTFRQVLDKHYALQEEVRAMQAERAAPPKSTGAPPGSGPSDTMILGLRVAPVDTQTLADGTKLTFVKKEGLFKFI